MADHETGCKESPIDLRDFIFKKNKVCSGNYPEKFELPKCVKVKNQKIISSCVAHATSEVLEYFEEGKVKLSTNFIYGNRTSSGKGMYLREACKTAYEYGDMLEADCPGNTEVDEVFDIAADALKDKDKVSTARNYRVAKYVKIKSEDDLKYALMTYGPVLAALNWYKVYTIDKTTGELVFDKTSEKSGHAVMLYGWDGEYWLYQNSWGTTWGNKGYFKTKDMPREAYELIDADNNDIVNPSHNSSLLKCILNMTSKLLNVFKR